VQFTVLLLFLLCIYLLIKYKKKMDGTIQYILKILSFYTLLMINVISLPFFNVFIFAFNCKSSLSAFQDLTCYSGLHILHMVFSALNLLIWVFFTTMFTTFFCEYNPISDLPFAGPLSKIPLYKYLLKMILVFYFFLDINVSCFDN